VKVKRSVEGLKKNAQAKRQEAFNKVEKGIQTLIKEKRTINFNQVAEASGVSKAWLYKEPEIKERIEHLRAQSKRGKKLPRKISATEASTRAINATLKARVKKVEAENRELRRQNETVYSQLLRLRELEKQVELLKAENQKLKDRPNTLPTEKKVFKSELEKLGVQINSTIQQLINGTPSGIVEAAMQALREAQSRNAVNNPNGWLYQAITEAWQPNESLQNNSELAQFNEWWPEARKQGLVIASEQRNGVLYVCTANQDWISFENAAKQIDKQKFIQSRKVDG